MAYGWNYMGLGWRDNSTSINHFKKRDRAIDPEQTIAFTDTFNQYYGGYIALCNTLGYQPDERHNGKAEIAWLDGHVSPRRNPMELRGTNFWEYPFYWAGDKNCGWGTDW
jgi:prepilin-type processing-associated H-X9-DG protein